MIKPSKSHGSSYGWTATTDQKTCQAYYNREDAYQRLCTLCGHVMRYSSAWPHVHLR